MLPLPWCLQNNIRLFSSRDFNMPEAMSHNLYASKANVVSDPRQPIAESHRSLIMRIRERNGGEMTRCNETRWITKYIRKKVSFFAFSAPISGRRDLYIWGFAAFGESKRAPYRNWVQTRQCENIVKCFYISLCIKRVRTCKVFCFIQNVIFLVLLSIKFFRYFRGVATRVLRSLLHELYDTLLQFPTNTWNGRRTMFW